MSRFAGIIQDLTRSDMGSSGTMNFFIALTAFITSCNGLYTTVQPNSGDWAVTSNSKNLDIVSGSPAATAFSPSRANSPRLRNCEEVQTSVMGFKHRHYLAGTKVYSCSVCRTHMATLESMISRRFNGQHGQAYLFDAVFNIIEGEAEDRQMTTGLHRVRDIRCAKCGQVMGWKYERAYEQAQRYKEGKSILEKALLIESTPITSASTNPDDLSSHAQLVNLEGSSPGDEGSVSGRSSLSIRSMSVGSV
ncbi:MAG: hypothetical protein CYPHOPRED_000141 [Cyphobasidiales sp. Tagirdzhanova-0007]|nr:MAG: hypothetical protein CYPHOPRED_000141 [Cyphobasidiales sp. Tagirdzhanova-0007]